MNRGQVTKVAAILAVAAINVLAEQRVQASATSHQRRRIVISIPDRKLVLFENNRVLRAYDVAVGKRSTPTPRGSFVVINRVQHPTWFGPAGPVPPGKDNPLGTRWMGLSARGYGIHGTNVPSSIGKAASHGCIRMRQRDVEELYELVTVGTEVELRAEPSELLAKVFSTAVSD